MSDTTGCAGPGKVWTPSGKWFDLLNPNPDDVTIDDIAWTLSRIPRWNGWTFGPVYSVGQHSCLVGDAVFEATQSTLGAFAGLMHDASEAYTGDCPRPLKIALWPTWDNIEDEVQWAIMRRFGLSLESWKRFFHEVKDADNLFARREAEELMTSRGHGVDWGDTPKCEIDVLPWSEEKTRIEFMERFERWKPKT